MPRHETEQDICDNALTVQDAPNLTGVLGSFHEDAILLRRIYRDRKDTKDSDKHPAMFLYATQILFLTGGGSVDSIKYGEATQSCLNIKEGKSDEVP